MKSAIANTPRKRGRPAASDSGSRKRRQPATAATVAALSQPNLANLHPSALASMAQHANPEVAAFLHAQQNQSHAINAGTRVTAHSGFIPQTRAIPSDMPAAYANVIAADPGLGYGAGPSVAAMSNPALISYEYGHLYDYTTELGDNITDSGEGTSSTGQLASSPFVMRASPMLDAQAQAQAHAQAQVHTPYLGFMSNSYFSGYDVHPPPNAMGVPTTSNEIDQQARGLGIHASGPFFGTNGQMFPAQMQSQGQYIAGNAVRQAEPMIPQIPTLPPSKRKSGHHGSQPNVSPQVVVRQHAQSGVPAFKAHLNSIPLVRQTVVSPHVDHNSLLNRPPLDSASLTTSRPTTASSRLSPAVLHAPTPRTCAADSPAILLSTPPPPTSTPLHPPTPSPAMTSAPTPFGSTSSELSSIPSESPTVAKAELLHDSACESSPKNKSMDPASPVVVPPTAVPKPDQKDRPLFVSSAVYASVVAKLDQALLDIQQMTEQLDKLATPNPLASEGLIVSVNNGLASAERRASAHQVRDNMLESNFIEVTRAKGKSEGRVSKSQVEAERDNLKTSVVAQKEELAKVNFFLQQVMERAAHLEDVKEFHLSQLNNQANEISTLRTELTEAHGKIAQMVAIRGVALAEVSPVGLAPPLERTNSSSAPTTPIYTPTMPLLSGPLATVDPPHRSITPVRSSSLPTSLTSAAGMTALHELTPRVCHNTSDNISVVPAPAPVEPGSPWKNWLQLDTTSAV